MVNLEVLQCPYQNNGLRCSSGGGGQFFPHPVGKLLPNAKVERNRVGSKSEYYHHALLVLLFILNDRSKETLITSLLSTKRLAMVS